MRFLPAWTPALLRKHPALLVEWLRLTNTLSRWRGAGGGTVAVVLSALMVVVALLFAMSGRVGGLIQTAAEYWVLLALVAAIYAATSVSGRKRQLEEARSQSWLIATPIPPRSLLMTQAIRALLPLLATIVAVVMFPALVAALNEGITAAAGKVAAAAAGGLLIGGAVGWWTGRRVSPSGIVPSRYVPKPRVRRSVAARASGALAQSVNQPKRESERVGNEPARSSGTVTPSSGKHVNAVGTFTPGSRDLGDAGLLPDSSALAGWPIAQVFSWSRPENSRYVLIAALLAVQGGSSAIAGLSVVAMYFVASYLAALLPSMTTVAKSAAVWLRATPITLMGFVWSVSRRALAHQLVGTVLAVACMLLLGAPAGMALQVAALWLGLFVSISGCALIDNYRGRSPLVKIALSVATFAALASVLQLRVGAKT